MPFGIKKPLEYTRTGRTVIHPESYDSCPICGRPINQSADTTTPVAPCLFPPTDLPDYDLVVILGCSTCYQSQKRLGFYTVGELVEHRSSKHVREKRTYVKQPKKAVEVPRASHLVQRLPVHDDFLVQLYVQIGDELRSKGFDLSSLHQSQEIIGRPDTEESELSRKASCQGLPDDDIEFGMTDEQRARMDRAVHAASERTKLIPSEAWNGKTADEILGDDVPNGW